LLVSIDRLGAIHQVLVTAEAIARRGLELAGVVLNRLTPALDPKLDNAADLRRWLGIEPITVAHGAAPDPDAAEAIQALIERLIAPR